MLLLILRRLIIGFLTLLVISVLVFAGTEILPGDVATAVLGQSATEETVQALRLKMGLDDPAPVRYFLWLSGIVQGDLGESLATGRDIFGLITERLLNTFVLALFTALFAVPLALVLGILCALYPDSFVDRSISYSTLVLISLPEFFTAALLVFLFAVTWNIFPAVVRITSFGNIGVTLHNLMLPILTLTAALLAHMTRMTRSTILDVLHSGYIEIALLKGVPKKRIVLRHAFPNSLGPIINVIATNLGYLVSGVVVVEAVFAYPGLGQMMVDCVTNRDIPLVQAVAMLFCTFYIGLNLVADVLIIMTNPRLRYKK
jgi:peptide/nickel transport system permease protein